MTPGTEVEVREKDGKAVVEPENSPGEILERMDQLVEEASPSREEAAPPPFKKLIQVLSNTQMSFSDTQRTTVMSDTGGPYLPMSRQDYRRVMYAPY